MSLLSRTPRRLYSTNRIYSAIRLPPKSTASAPIREGVRADPEPLLEAAHEIWTRRQLGQAYTPPGPSVPEFFEHPLYTPLADPQTGLGPIIYPLKWPEFDQKTLSAQATGYERNWTAYEFDDAATAPIGDYPRDIPFQWTQLKDPFKYWDQQGRRNYGDILQDHDQFTDWLSPGPEVSWVKPAKNLIGILGVFALMGLGVSVWDPADHRYWTERKFPHNGLRLELGGDPDDETDDWMAAKHH